MVVDDNCSEKETVQPLYVELDASLQSLHGIHFTVAFSYVGWHLFILRSAKNNHLKDLLWA